MYLQSAGGTYDIRGTFAEAKWDCDSRDIGLTFEVLPLPQIRGVLLQLTVDVVLVPQSCNRGRGRLSSIGTTTAHASACMLQQHVAGPGWHAAQSRLACSLTQAGVRLEPGWHAQFTIGNDPE